MSERRYRIGTSGWAYADWKGPFYPPRTRSGDYLRSYAEHFDTVEVDSSFYGLPRPEIIERWCRVTPDHFRFALKCPRLITHDRSLTDIEGPLQALLQAGEQFGEKLAALLFQLPPSFQARHLVRVKRLLDRLPGDVPCALEVRHPSWLEVGGPELAREHQVAWVCTDRLPAREVTGNLVYLRLLGDQSKEISFDQVQYDVEEDLGSWAAWLRDLPEQAVTVLAFINNHYSGHSPATASALRRLLGLTGVQIPRQGELF